MGADVALSGGEHPSRQPYPHQRAVGSLVHLQSTQAGVVATVLATGSTVGVGRSSEHQAEADARMGFASAVCLGSDACRNGLQGHYLIQPMSN